MQAEESGWATDRMILVQDRGMLALLLFWWRLKQANGGTVLPTRRQMDPCAFPRSILPNMFIYERDGDRRLRCRLSGTRMRELFGVDGTGLYLDQMMVPASVPGRNALFHDSLDNRMPMFYRGYLVPAGRGWRGFNRLLLPVSVEPGAPPAQVMGMVRVFDPPPGNRDAADADGLVSARLLGDGECGELAE
ncbi:PAS domain-containing protein [Niveispirillum sp. KHB5.9]|uniref:PAS domain-containing protein n=1 Tax=Niveispirillum sp. KHB5.9 TaxID=3400269 RepID=UPI003A8C5996